MAEIEDLKIVGGSTYTVGNQDIIANEWEAGKTYVKGKSYVIREHRLYVCNVTHTSVEPFDATKWTEITIGDAIAANTTAIGDLSTLTTSDKSSLVGAVNSIYPTKDIGGTAKGVSGTYQIPAGVLNHSIITIAMRRYAYAGEVTILAENITAGAYTNGLTVFGAHDKYAEFSISTTGLITITAISNWAEVYIDLIGIF